MPNEKTKQSSRNLWVQTLPGKPGTQGLSFCCNKDLSDKPYDAKEGASYFEKYCAPDPMVVDGKWYEAEYADSSGQAGSYGCAAPFYNEEDGKYYRCYNKATTSSFGTGCLAEPIDLEPAITEFNERNKQ